MYLTDMKEIDNDYAIIQAKYNCDCDRYECWGGDEPNIPLYEKKLEALAELGQKESIFLWKISQLRRKIRGKSFKENKKIDEQIEKMDKDCIVYKIYSIDKLEAEGETFECIKRIDECKERYDKLEEELSLLEDLNLEKEIINERISKVKIQQDNIKQQANLEWGKILETPYFDAIYDLAVNKFNNLMNSVSTLDKSFLYMNTLVLIDRYNRALRKIGSEKLHIVNDNKKDVEKKLKALYKANPNNPYVALRYANFLRYESALLKLTGRKIMKKISKMPLSENAESILAKKFLNKEDNTINI